MAVGITDEVHPQPVGGVRVGVAELGGRAVPRNDLTLIEFPADTTCAGVFTQNAFCAAPVTVATAAMEARGGNGYIEDWVAPRLIRDAQVGLLWEGTSSINALDVVQRAVGKAGAHENLQDTLEQRLAQSNALPAGLRDDLRTTLGSAIDLAVRVAGDHTLENLSRRAATALYDATSAVLLAAEGAALGGAGGDARRLLLSRMVLDHRLTADDPLNPQQRPDEDQAIGLLLSDEPVPLDTAIAVSRA